MDEKACIELTTAIISAYVQRNPITVTDLPSLIEDTARALASLRASSEERPNQVSSPPSPAAIRKSISRDALISFIDGRAYKQLKRHLAKNGITPEEYRQRYGLPADYPLVAPAYSARRSELAKAAGLGSRTRGHGKRS